MSRTDKGEVTHNHQIPKTPQPNKKDSTIKYLYLNKYHKGTDTY